MSKVILRTATAAEIAASSGILENGRRVKCSDQPFDIIGDGVTATNALPKNYDLEEAASPMLLGALTSGAPVQLAESSVITLMNMPLDVTKFGLVGDGITDDSAALQTLINSRSGTINLLFPDGYSFLLMNIDIDDFNTARILDSYATIKLLDGADDGDYLFRFSGNKNVFIGENLTLDFNRANSVSTAAGYMINIIAPADGSGQNAVIKYSTYKETKFTFWNITNAASGSFGYRYVEVNGHYESSEFSMCRVHGWHHFVYVNNVFITDPLGLNVNGTTHYFDVVGTVQYNGYRHQNNLGTYGNGYQPLTDGTRFLYVNKFRSDYSTSGTFFLQNVKHYHIDSMIFEHLYGRADGTPVMVADGSGGGPGFKTDQYYYNPFSSGYIKDIICRETNRDSDVFKGLLWLAEGDRNITIDTLDSDTRVILGAFDGADEGRRGYKHYIKNAILRGTPGIEYMDITRGTVIDTLRIINNETWNGSAVRARLSAGTIRRLFLDGASLQILASAVNARIDSAYLSGNSYITVDLDGSPTSAVLSNILGGSVYFTGGSPATNYINANFKLVDCKTYVDPTDDAEMTQYAARYEQVNCIIDHQLPQVDDVTAATSSLNFLTPTFEWDEMADSRAYILRKTAGNNNLGHIMDVLTNDPNYTGGKVSLAIGGLLELGEDADFQIINKGDNVNNRDSDGITLNVVVPNYPQVNPDVNLLDPGQWRITGGWLYDSINDEWYIENASTFEYLKFLPNDDTGIITVSTSWRLELTLVQHTGTNMRGIVTNTVVSTIQTNAGLGTFPKNISVTKAGGAVDNGRFWIAAGAGESIRIRGPVRLYDLS